MTIHPKTARVPLAFLLLFAAWLGGLYAFTRDLAEGPPAEMPKVDAIVVLTGGTKRLDAGFELLEKGFGKKLFISGVYRGVEVRELLERSKKTASNLDCCVELGFEADDTIGNAREATAWLRRENFKSFYLVTANYHLKRALMDFSAFGDGLSPIPYAVQPEGLDMHNWWREGATRGLILREYMKFIAALVWRPFASAGNA
ncbi:MAG TPA: YdcF family protein [Patescibacteria group bacterium]|nr:YdcF family protein [Patescibacteria group bacterium]